jgi:NAD(P)H-hydrate epimerase
MGTTAATEAAKATVLPEVLSAVVSDTEVLGPDALERFASVIDTAGALAIGPGLGRGDAQRALVTGVLGRVDLPVVADADALNALAESTDALVRRSGATVITPHPGELARLLDTSIAEIQADRLGVARAAARRFDCVVLLKGSRTCVAEPGGRVVVNPTGSSHLATAGTGDVLTGAIAALLAAGVPPFEAAWATAYVHGEAGRLAVQRVGSGVLAWDVAEALSVARAALEEA